MGKLNTISEIKLIYFQNINNLEAEMNIFNDINNFFKVKRIFTVRNKIVNCNRGHHAHKNCEQIITCPIGKIKFKVDDGKNKKTYIIQDNKFAIYVPNYIWTETTYLDLKTTLVCYCSEDYDEISYIRSYKDFIQYRKDFN